MRYAGADDEIEARVTERQREDRTAAQSDIGVAFLLDDHAGRSDVLFTQVERPHAPAAAAGALGGERQRSSAPGIESQPPCQRNLRERASELQGGRAQFATRPLLLEHLSVNERIECPDVGRGARMGQVFWHQKSICIQGMTPSGTPVPRSLTTHVPK